jgi:DNA polymerase III delta prime subunit
MKGVLNKLNDSLLLNFVELLELLIANPVEAANKVQELRSILINFHHVLNAYREHEVGFIFRSVLHLAFSFGWKKAREELVYLLTKQAQERQDVLVKLHSAQRDVQRKQK